MHVSGLIDVGAKLVLVAGLLREDEVDTGSLGVVVIIIIILLLLLLLLLLGEYREGGEYKESHILCYTYIHTYRTH